jgi:hypothetical protein
MFVNAALLGETMRRAIAARPSTKANSDLRFRSDLALLYYTLRVRSPHS